MPAVSRDYTDDPASWKRNWWLHNDNSMINDSKQHLQAAELLLRIHQIHNQLEVYSGNKQTQAEPQYTYLLVLLTFILCDFWFQNKTNKCEVI